MKSLLRDKDTTKWDWDMNHLLEQSDKKFKITIIVMLKVLEENVDNMHEQMEYFSREIETERRKWKCYK